MFVLVTLSFFTATMHRGVCIVSGCSRGIGRAVAKKLASSWSLGLLARSEQELNELKQLLIEENKKRNIDGNQFLVAPCDIQDENSIKYPFKNRLLIIEKLFVKWLIILVILLD